ncbi:hypothetical protein ISN45_Aa06g029290 [Arabidopsis thaliana x Arabidopsis arenosa]|uniref:Arabidopsis retrotransposon Orf1 C-terminal domain-containing protein n=1 Tax=Arabidopsis thaliana x Arabidopsis arenosa TaxID=1240361 RepID=A0A8T1Z0Z0_9BRAS|nr:hypothetical protein ISN45_Aa06g029290 [Arabidopsis thaliana x Arabidopsis arenosa]
MVACRYPFCLPLSSIRCMIVSRCPDTGCNSPIRANQSVPNKRFSVPMDSKNSSRRSRYSRPLEEPVRIFEVTDDIYEERRSKRYHDRARDKGKVKQVEEDSTTSNETHDDQDDDFMLTSLVPKQVGATLRRLSRQQPPRRELPMKFVGQPVKDDVDYREIINKIKLTPSLLIDYSTFRALDLDDDVIWMLDSLGLRRFMESIRREIYEEETRQFLATVSLAFPRTSSPLARDGVLYFTIHGDHFTISIPHLGRALGFDYEDAIDFGPETHGDILQRIGKGPFSSGKTKSALISHPAIRCVHKLLATSIFTRTAHNNVLGDDLLVSKTPFVDFPRMWMSDSHSIVFKCRTFLRNFASMKLMTSKLSWVMDPNLKSIPKTFDLHPQSESTVDSLDDLRRLCHIPPEVEMIVPEPFESPESGREGYCCAYEIYFKGCGLFFPLPEIFLTYLNHLGIAFSQMSPNMLRYLLCTFTVVAEAGYSLRLCELLELFQARESQTSGYYALYPIADRSLIDSLPLKNNAWRKFWFFFRINSFTIQSSSELLRVHWSLNLGPQIRPVPSIDFLNFYKAVLERPVNWNSFTLERIHGAGFSVRMSLTNPVDPPPAEIDLSSLNARDRRKIKEANKKIKDQISLVGRDKKNETSTGDDKFYRKTLLVDDGSLEGSKSMAVAMNNASPSIPAADNVVAATVEEEGLASDSSLMKKRKAEELDPLPQGRPKSTRKGRAAPSNLSIPEPAGAQDTDPNSGTVSKEPLGSGMQPPRRPRGNTSRVRSSPSSGLVARASFQADKEKIGNKFRCFHTRAGKKLPSFDWWKPDVKRMYISHSFHSSQATLDMNGIVNFYEEELAKVSKKVAAAEGEIEKLQSSNRLVQETAGLDSARREEIERLERSSEETRKTLIETEQKLETALADHNFAKGEIELLRSELIKVKAVAEELERKNESLSELKDRDVRKISHDARKEVKGTGQKFLLAVQEFIAADKIEDGKVNLAEEKETVGAELAETEAKLNTAPQPYLNLQQFASEFADSPPLTEPNIGSSLDEMMLTGSPSAHFNEFGTNVDRISSGRAQGPSDQGLVTSSIMGDDVESRNETPQDVSSLNPEVVFATQDDDVGGALVSSQAREEGGDGFTPQGVAIPCFLSSMSKEEKIECHEFMEQITERYVSLYSERQRLGRKRRVLEERIARTERKIRRLESDVHNWERRGFDSIARIPSCLREHIRFLKKYWDIYQKSLEPDERESGSSSDEVPSTNPPPSYDDLPGAPDIELAKTGRAGEPEGSRRLRKGTSIQVPIALIERLSAQDRVKAEEFINKLITRHDELEDEKKEIRKKRRELGKRCLDIARELHCLEAHPSDWIELGLQEYGNMPGCIMSIVDLAGQGAELFRNSRPF